MRRKKKRISFADIEKTREYQETRKLVSETVSQGLPTQGTPEDLDMSLDIMANRMSELFASAFPGITLTHEAKQRLEKAVEEAKKIARREAFPGLFQ